MQEFLLPAVFTLGYHTPKPLEVLTAVTAAKLENLILRGAQGKGCRIATSEPGGIQVKGLLQVCGEMWVGVEGSYLPIQDLRLATEEAVAVVTAQVNAPLRACTLEGRRQVKEGQNVCSAGGEGNQPFSLFYPGLPTPILLPSLCYHTLYPWSRVWSTWNLVQQLGLQNW